MAGRRLEDFAKPIAMAATVLGVIAAAAVLLTAPASIWLRLPVLGISVPPGTGSVVAAVVLAVAGWRLLRASEDAAFTLLVLACLLAGVGAHEVAAIRAAEYAIDPGFQTDHTMLRATVFVAYLDLFAASALVAGIWAAAPARALGSWVGPFGGAVFLLTLVGAANRAAMYPALTATPIDLSGIWRSGLLVLAVWLIGAAGSVRAAGLAHLAAGRPVPPTAPTPRVPAIAWAGAIAAAAGVLAALQHGMAVGNTALVLGPLLWLLVALVVIRWSPTSAWAALTLSLALAAGSLASDAPLASWALLLAATATGWSALAQAVPGRVATRGRAIALAVATVTGLPILLGAGASVLMAAVFAPSAGFPIEGLWSPALVFGPVVFAGLAVLRQRLVPAVAEAEAVAGEPFAPSRYVAALVAEAITAQARVRAETAEVERRRLASDLHTEVLPGLAQASADAEAGASPDAVRARLRAVESDVRSMMAGRHHVVLEEFGLVEALEWLAGRAEEGRGLEATVEVDPATTEERPPRPVERAAFRVAQLAVENVVRHAQASRVGIRVLVSAQCVRVTVADDGRGFDPAAPTTGFGLADMRLQAAEAGARVEVGPADGGGTRVAFTWPR